MGNLKVGEVMRAYLNLVLAVGAAVCYNFRVLLFLLFTIFIFNYFRVLLFLFLRER